MNKDGKFTEVFDKNNIIKKFTLPNVKEGSIIEFKYKIKSDFIFTLRGWCFQSGVPTLWTEYNLRIPEYLTYKHNMSGYFEIQHPVHTTENANYVNGVNSNASYDKYCAENVPALKDEPFVTTMDDYRPKIEFELRASHFPNSMYEDYNGSWPKIITGLAERDDFGGYLNKNGLAKSTLPAILKGEKDTLAMVKLITNHLKSQIKWNNRYDIFSSENNPKSIFDKKTGNSADINLALLAFLKEAKIKAFPVLISTRTNGQHPGYPVISAFNNVVGVTEIAGQLYFLDALDLNIYRKTKTNLF
ncbi:hypothetical protein [Pedobacter rhizosphaerae]|uniref:Transglutaminase-like superfamily protein n=1 Tax=Pedobacter rhizosphaerae TaxID=390241 RepID=A0A1H9PDV8_9SPHI|nr:hypothetical protein [Pedobacter rhizosphaerae]SER46364.1 hypothetical protein SAMN04488023_109149 [Pedobacter rhizosphaerae]